MEGDYRGHDGIRRWWENLLDSFPDFTIKADAVRDHGGLTVSGRRSSRGFLHPEAALGYSFRS